MYDWTLGMVHIFFVELATKTKNLLRIKFMNMVLIGQFDAVVFKHDCTNRGFSNQDFKKSPSFSV